MVDVAVARALPYLDRRPTLAPMNPTDLPATVLLVDDDQDLLAVFSESLRPHFRTDLARSVMEAEALLQVRKYKVIVSDHKMPGGDGLAFLSRVRKLYPDSVRLLLTSHMDPKLLQELDEASPHRYLLKPISITDLLKAVQAATRLHDEGPNAA